MALKLSLKANERIAINGAVLTNGNRRTDLTVENQARILRESDIMQAGEANTPAKRIYLPVMMMYLDPSSRQTFHGEFVLRLTQFLEVIEHLECQQKCLTIAAHIANEDYYKALSDCRYLIQYEKDALVHVA